jgi:hypothetical protein
MNGKVNESDDLKHRSSEPAQFSTLASAVRVNRTHRVVRERAAAIKEQKLRIRTLYLPMLICTGLVAALVFALWSVMNEYDLVPSGWPDASQQMLVLTLWFLPLSGLLLGVVWFRRNLTSRDGRLK